MNKRPKRRGRPIVSTPTHQRKNTPRYHTTAGASALGRFLIARGYAEDLAEILEPLTEEEAIQAVSIIADLLGYQLVKKRKPK